MLVTGFSMGGRGTWFMAAHHADLFTAAIPMAASVGDEPVERPGDDADLHHPQPTRMRSCRSRPARTNAQALEKLGRPVKFEAVCSLTHFQMDAYVPSLKRAGRWIAERW